MPYDPALAERVRGALAVRDHLREVRMFGGLALMVDERMVVCVSGDGLLVRVDPERDAELVAEPGARRAVMGRDRSMGPGWVLVDGQTLASDEGLRRWLDVALEFHARAAAAAPPTS